MAMYGSENLAAFAAVPALFGNLCHFILRDTGLAFLFKIVANFGFGGGSSRTLTTYAIRGGGS